MSNYHYYSKEPKDLHSNPNCFDFNFKEKHFKFNTDDGVFSKEYIDYGSFALLKAFEPNDLEEPILDMGAGYGPISIVVSSLYKKEVHACEINERAYELMKKNISCNKESNVIPYHSDLFQELPNDLMFGTVLTNPPIRAGKNVVFSIYDGAYERLVKGGELWVVIQKKQGAPSSKEHIESLFGNCEIITRDKGYYILKAIK